MTAPNINPTAPLYALVHMRDLIDGMLAETEGELTPEIEAILDQLDGATKEKIERVALYVREQVATAKAIQEESDRLQARAAAKLKAADGLKGYLKTQMERLGMTKVEGLLATVAIQKNPPSVKCDVPLEDVFQILDDEDAADGMISRIEKVEFRLNRDPFLAAHKAGDTALLAHYERTIGVRVEQGTSLRVR
ncbi:MAG TPA: siphovirus Gp157 family protein [Vicinamibacterales bacterium]